MLRLIKEAARGRRRNAVNWQEDNGQLRHGFVKRAQQVQTGKGVMRKRIGLTPGFLPSYMPATDGDGHWPGVAHPLLELCVEIGLISKSGGRSTQV